VNDSASLVPDAVDFAALPAARLEEMTAAGAEIVECVRVLVKSGGNLVGELLRDAGTFYEWNHYPEGDIYDHETHAQYYYHAHPTELRGGEHGHFHTFLRIKGMPPNTHPAPVADLEIPKGDNDILSHIIGISMDPHGIPIRLFTVNRWVTGEVWFAAADVIRMIDRFEIDLARPSWPVNRWLNAMLRLFRPQIVALIEARDRRLGEWAADHPERNAYEDRELEVTSTIDISIDDQIAAVHAARAARG
jgi:Domain of unknown function (DUF6969)